MSRAAHRTNGERRSARERYRDTLRAIVAARVKVIPDQFVRRAEGVTQQ